MANISYNNKLICETYKADRDLRKVVNNGFAVVEQKSKVVGLTVLMNAKLANGDIVLAGSKAYVKEKLLRDSQMFKETFEADTINERFLVVDLNHVDFIAPPSGDAA
jgi:hypothetical protein